jgi:hypothetical protein
VIAAFPRLHTALIGHHGSESGGSRVRRSVGLYWRAIAVAVEVTAALATLGIVAALPALIAVVSKPIRRVTVDLLVLLVGAWSARRSRVAH